jgi:ADP-heptose:LPS heptosyltransferase
MEIAWENVRRVLVIRLRSIGDTVLATPSLNALKRFVPDAQVDILLEDWVAPVLDEFDALDNIVTVSRSATSRLATAWQIRRTRYDVVFNLHGGTTATFFAYATGAPHRVGYSHYQYKFLFNHVLSSSADFWRRPVTHSAEQQLAMLGFVGVPVDDAIKTRLVVTERAMRSLEEKFAAKSQTPLKEFGEFVLMHPAAAFDSKQWPARKFARTAELLNARGLRTIAVASAGERGVLDQLMAESKVEIACFDDLSLPEITALASRATVFIGNDSGIAHIAAAVGTPTVVIFGPSNVDHWRPWTDAPNEVVRGELIASVGVEEVAAAVERIIAQKEKRRESHPAVPAFSQEN